MIKSKISTEKEVLKGKGIILSLMLLLKYILLHSLEESISLGFLQMAWVGKTTGMNSQIHKTRKGKEINSNVKLVQTQSAVKSIKQINGGKKGGRKISLISLIFKGVTGITCKNSRFFKW